MATGDKPISKLSNAGTLTNADLLPLVQGAVTPLTTKLTLLRLYNYVRTGLAALASPAFTGTPTAPTPAPGDDSTKLATTAFIASAMEAFQEALDSKAPLDSAELTGTPTAPTPSLGDTSDRLATMAAIAGAITAAKPMPIVVVTTNKTPALNESSSYFQCFHASGLEVTLPNNTTVAFPVGTLFTFEQADVGGLTFVEDTSVTINTAPYRTLITTRKSSVVHAIKTAINDWTLFGDLERSDDAPVDGKMYVREDGAWVEVTQDPGAYDLPFNFGTSVIAASEVCSYILGRAIIIPANFAGLVGRVGTNPTATAVFTIRANTTTIGTISISTSGVITVTATTPGTTMPYAAGTRISVTAPSTPDTTLAGFECTVPTERAS